MNFPDDLKYTADHEWVLVDGDVALVGITDSAQEEISDVTAIEVPEVGTEFTQGDPAGTIEAAEETREYYAAVTGEVVEVNEDVQEDPSLINADAYGEGWIYKISISSHDELDNLMDAYDYEEFISQ